MSKQAVTLIAFTSLIVVAFQNCGDGFLLKSNDSEPDTTTALAYKSVQLSKNSMDQSQFSEEMKNVFSGCDDQITHLSILEDGIDYYLCTYSIPITEYDEVSSNFTRNSPAISKEIQEEGSFYIHQIAMARFRKYGVSFYQSEEGDWNYYFRKEEHRRYFGEVDSIAKAQLLAYGHGPEKLLEETNDYWRFESQGCNLWNGRYEINEITVHKKTREVERHFKGKIEGHICPIA